MGVIRLRLPDSLHEHVRNLAERENVSLSHLATLAIAEKVAALETEEHLLGRAFRADRRKFLQAMRKVAKRRPADEDTR